MENTIIGPALPPHLKDRFPTRDDEKGDHLKADVDLVDSKHSAPQSSSSQSEELCEKSESDMYGPVLPPHLKKNSEESLPSQSIIGPSLPNNVDKLESLVDSPTSDVHHLTSSEDESVFGPPIPGIDSGSSEVMLTQQKLEMRAQYLKRKMAEEVSSEIS